MLKGFKTSDFVSKQVFYHSKDGTRIPMFIIHHKDFKQDGKAPGLQYGYVRTAGLTALVFSPMWSSLLHPTLRDLQLESIVGRFWEFRSTILLAKVSRFCHSLRGCGCCDKYQRRWRVRWRMARCWNVSGNWISATLSRWIQLLWYRLNTTHVLSSRFDNLRLAV